MAKTDKKEKTEKKEKKGKQDEPKKKKKAAKRASTPYVVRVVRAVHRLEDNSGTGRQSVFKYVRDHYSDDDMTDNRLKVYVAVGLKKAMAEGYLYTRTGHPSTYLLSNVGRRFLKNYKKCHDVAKAAPSRKATPAHKKKSSSPSPAKEKKKSGSKKSSDEKKDKKKDKKSDKKSPKKKADKSPKSSPSSSARRRTRSATKKEKEDEEKSKDAKSVKRSLARAFEEAAKEGEEETKKSPAKRRKVATGKEKGKGKGKEAEPEKEGEPEAEAAPLEGEEPTKGRKKKAPAKKPAQPRKKKAAAKEVSSTVVAPDVTMNGVAFNTTDRPDIRADVKSIIKTLLQDDDVGVGIIANRGVPDAGGYKLEVLDFTDDATKIDSFVEESYGEGSEWLAYYRMVLESAKDLLWAKCKTRTLILVGDHGTDVLQDKSLEALTYKLETMGVRVFGFHHSQLELLQQLIVNNELH
eukprot:TRINITY_DN5432_c0_g1_i1.p1 TRINITY_DN5432_c0_g1~~TRINITY_DN5432_c0_g1_i1.p1  ORF type:complete len:464 (+),score=192.10 TRINITY_DN5432_c0_g1_i1:59-1450(+)